MRAVVLELDQERRRIKLGIKQLEPTTADEYIGEHQVGESVTGRIVEASRGQAKVELGEGVFAECRIRAGSRAAGSRAPAAASGRFSSLTAMFSAKWKQGASAAIGRGRSPSAPARSALSAF